MKDIYSDQNSDYLQMTNSWHVEDSPWKALQVLKMIRKNNLRPKTIVEVGCGAGEILYSLNNHFYDGAIQYDGYDIAPDAIKIAQTKTAPNINFYCENFAGLTDKHYDLLLMIDVFEHVPDYLGFIERCNQKAVYKIFHIPLDIHASGVLRNRLTDARKDFGHLHYFTKETAIATLKDTGLEIIDFFYTDMYKLSKKGRTMIANLPRAFMFPILPDITVKLLGGYSLLVLAK